MFVAPPEKEVEWTDAGLEGAFRFLMRVWRIVQQWRDTVASAPPVAGLEDELTDAERALRRKTHDTVRRVTQDLDPRVHLNTVVSALMELVNELYQFSDQQTAAGAGAKRGDAPAAEERPRTRAVIREAIETLVLMLSPFTPHMAEELWEALARPGGIVFAPWPAFDPAVAKADEVVTISIDSAANEGTMITLSLPLTLAIIEGLLVRVGPDNFVIPLSMVEECIELIERAKERDGRHLVNVRDRIVPYIRLREQFMVKGTAPAIQQIVIVNAEGTRVGFAVDSVIGEHQTVIKSLGRFYHDVQGISGATILGDGSVALILDVPQLIQRVAAEEYA